MNHGVQGNASLHATKCINCLLKQEWSPLPWEGAETAGMDRPLGNIRTVFQKTAAVWQYCLSALDPLGVACRSDYNGVSVEKKFPGICTCLAVRKEEALIIRGLQCRDISNNSTLKVLYLHNQGGYSLYEEILLNWYHRVKQRIVSVVHIVHDGFSYTPISTTFPKHCTLIRNIAIAQIWSNGRASPWRYF